MAGRLPSDIAAALDPLVRGLDQEAGADLLGVAVYGGVAKGRYTPGISDINLLIVVRQAEFALLARLAPLLVGARRRHRVTPLLATPADLTGMARLYPAMFEDIAGAHMVLHGDPGLGGLRVERSVLLLRLQQELKNHELRFRRTILESDADPTLLWPRLTATLPRLAATLETVLRLDEAPLPADRGEVLRAGAIRLGVSAAQVEPFARAHRHEAAPPAAELAVLLPAFGSLLAELSRGALERSP